MNIMVLKDEGLNIEVINQCFGGNEDIYFKFLRRFFEDNDYINFNELMVNGTYSEAFNSAHALKGVAGNLGMIKIYEYLLVIVEKLRNFDYDDLEDIYISFKKECDRIQMVAERMV